MTDAETVPPLLQGLDKNDYQIQSLDDEIRVDRLCFDLLRHLCQQLIRQGGKDPEEAGKLCQGADYFLREFLIPDIHINPFEVQSGHVLQFAGHWYIIRTPEPNLIELGAILNGIAALYSFLAEQKLVPAGVAGEIIEQCRQESFYQQRIDDFWAIEENGFDAWRQACPLDPIES